MAIKINMHRKKMIEARLAKVKKDVRNDTGNMNVNKGYFYFSKRCFACQKYLFTGRSKTANNNSFGHSGRDGVQIPCYQIHPKAFSHKLLNP